MSIVKKVIYNAFGLLITVALIFTGYRIYLKAQETADGFSENQERTNQNIEEYAITKFEGYEINGSQAIYYAKEVIGKYDIPVTFKTTTIPAGFTVSDSSLYNDFRDINSSYYINPIVQYLVEVVRDENDVITGVVLSYVGP